LEQDNGYSSGKLMTLTLNEIDSLLDGRYLPSNERIYLEQLYEALLELNTTKTIVEDQKRFIKSQRKTIFFFREKLKQLIPQKD